MAQSKKFLQLLETINLERLRKHDLEELRKATIAELRNRFKKTKGPAAYGLLNRGFTDEEYSRFLQHVSSQRARTAFILMAERGLRIGEAVRIKTEHLDLTQRQLWIDSEKGSHSTMVLLHADVLRVLADWMQYRARWGITSEYLFPAKQRTNRRPYMSPLWLAREFRDAIKAAGLEFTYGVAKNNSRKLRRLTTHSLRHRFGQKVYNHTKDLLVTQHALRHKNPSSTTIYTHVPQQRVNAVLEEIFYSTAEVTNMANNNRDPVCFVARMGVPPPKDRIPREEMSFEFTTLNEDNEEILVEIKSERFAQYLERLANVLGLDFEDVIHAIVCRGLVAEGRTLPEPGKECLDRFDNALVAYYEKRAMA